MGVRTGVRLAFIASLQTLAARPRAVLVLRDVIGLSAAEAAEVLGTTTAAVNSALARARAQLRAAATEQESVAEPDEAGVRALLDAYVAAFEAADMARLTALLRADVELEMPPTPTWFTGVAAVSGFLRARVLGPLGRWRMVATSANGQPAALAYILRPDGAYVAHGVVVLTVLAGRIARIVAFNDVALVADFDDAPVAAPIPAPGPAPSPPSRGRHV